MFGLNRKNQKVKQASIWNSYLHPLKKWGTDFQSAGLSLKEFTLLLREFLDCHIRKYKMIWFSFHDTFCIPWKLHLYELYSVAKYCCIDSTSWTSDIARKIVEIITSTTLIYLMEKKNDFWDVSCNPLNFLHEGLIA